MIKHYSVARSSELDRHSDLVKLIGEESKILETTSSPDRIKRHTKIMDFLVELQCITSKDLKV